MKLFECSKFLELYKCLNCNYRTDERILMFTHMCDITGPKCEVKLKPCMYCNVGSFSYVWHYFHERRCMFSAITTVITKNAKKYIETTRCDQCKFSLNYLFDHSIDMYSKNNKFIPTCSKPTRF